MWLSNNILSKSVDISGIAPEELAQRITMASAEIEAVEYINAHLRTVVSAKITNKQPHPDSDHLTLVDLDTGEGEIVRVVCGAPNHQTGDIVALAKVGTALNGLVIKKSKIRGQESNGMICSEKELGFSEDHSGVMILPPGTEIGVSLSDLFPQWCDVRFEIDNKSITHRPDLWGHVGFAREISAVFGRRFTYPVNKALKNELSNKEELFVKIEAPQACFRYSLLKINGIRIAESPYWLKSAVSSIGMRPINNIVDITNYVMAELGLPLHAFDTAKLSGRKISVRMAEKNEPIVTLDGRRHVLTEEDIVIADDKGAVALAGVMGGESSDIEASTTSIILEAACFNPVNVRKTAQRHGCRTEAAMRFEKSLSPEYTEDALLRCYELIMECCPEAEAATEIIDSYPEKQRAVRISISTDTIRRQIGQDISDGRIISILKSLDFDVRDSGSLIDIGVPFYRSTKDVTIPADIVEEVGRIYGYDNIESKPPLVPCVPPAKNELRAFERSVKEILSRDQNMTEISGYSFVGENELKLLGIFEDKELRLKNPLSQESDRLNRTLVPNIMKALKINQKHFDDFAVYETGRVYLKEDRSSSELAFEERRVTGAFFAKRTEEPVFYAAKNAAVSLIKRLKIKRAAVRPASDKLPPYAHPGRTAAMEIAGKRAGLIFELHPQTADGWGIKGSAALFDLSLDRLFEAEKSDTVFRELRRFPEVPFELSVICKEREYASALRELIVKSRPKFVKEAEVIAVYKGEQLPPDKKSVSFRITFAADDHTLETKEVEDLQNAVISALAAKGYRLR